MNSAFNKAFGFIVCLGVGLAVGFWWGQRSLPPGSVPAPVTVLKPAREAKTPMSSAEVPEPQEMPDQTEASDGVGDLQSILKVKLMDERHRSLSEYARKLAAQNLPAAIAAFHSLRNVQDKAAFLDGLIDVYARLKPMESLEFLRDLPPGFLRNANLERALAIIAETSPQLAAEQIHSFLSGVDAHNALIRVSDVWGQTNPREAFGWAILNLQDAPREAAVEQVASSWAQTNPAEAIDHVLNASGLSAADRELALKAIAGTWAISEPDAAIAWAEEYFRTSGFGEPLQIALMNLAVNDPAAAAGRANQITDRELASQVYPAIASTWGSIAPNEASVWVNTLPVGEGKSAAVMQLAESWASVDPAGAIRWALQLPRSEPAREEAIQQAAMTWDRFNSAGMDQLLRSLTPAQAAEIQQLLQAPHLGKPQTGSGRE